MEKDDNNYYTFDIKNNTREPLSITLTTYILTLRLHLNIKQLRERIKHTNEHNEKEK